MVDSEIAHIQGTTTSISCRYEGMDAELEAVLPQLDQLEKALSRMRMEENSKRSYLLLDAYPQMIASIEQDETTPLGEREVEVSRLAEGIVPHLNILKQFSTAFNSTTSLAAH